jgi:hypothetical protein
MIGGKPDGYRHIIPVPQFVSNAGEGEQEMKP